MGTSDKKGKGWRTSSIHWGGGGQYRYENACLGDYRYPMRIRKEKKTI